MFVALSTAPFGVDMPVADYLSLAVRNGYRHVQISRAQILELSRLGFQHSHDLLETSRVLIVSFFVPVEWRRDEEIFQHDLRGLPTIAKLASQLGVKRGCTWVHPNYTSSADESRRWIGGRFRAIDQILADQGIRFGLEPLGPAHFLQEPGNTFIYGFEQALAFAEHLGPNVGLVVDSFHWYCMDSTENHLAEIPCERIIDVHIDDAPDVPREDQRDNERLLPGMGIIDLGGFLRGLSRAGYTGPVGIESFGPALQNMTPDEIAVKALQSWRELVERTSIDVLS